MKPISIRELGSNTEDNSNLGNQKKKDAKSRNLDRAISKDELMKGIEESLKAIYKRR